MLGRSRSPSRHGTPARGASAFSAYAVGGAQSFAAPTPKRPFGGSSGARGDGPSSSAGGVFGVSSHALDSGKEDDSGSGSGSGGEREKEKGDVSFMERLRQGKDAEADVEDGDTVGVVFASVTTTDWVPASPGTGPV